MSISRVGRWKRPQESREVEFDSRRSHCILRGAGCAAQIRSSAERRLASEASEVGRAERGRSPEDAARAAPWARAGPSSDVHFSALAFLRSKMGARKTSVSESSGGRASDRWERARSRRVPDAPAVPLFTERKWEPGRRATASLPAVARATGGSERGLGAFPTRRWSHFLFYSPPPTLFSALFSSKSSRTTSLSATRYRRGDVFGTSSISSTSTRRSV